MLSTVKFNYNQQSRSQITPLRMTTPLAFNLNQQTKYDLIWCLSKYSTTHFTAQCE